MQKAEQGRGKMEASEGVGRGVRGSKWSRNEGKFFSMSPRKGELGREGFFICTREWEGGRGEG